MELRDLFAGFYMCGSVAALEDSDDDLDYEVIAENAYRMADAMQEARTAEPGDEDDEDDED